LERHLKQVEKLAEQKVITYLEEINKAQKDAELWENEHKKV
jgi:hypothetical protein